MGGYSTSIYFDWALNELDLAQTKPFPGVKGDGILAKAVDVVEANEAPLSARMLKARIICKAWR